jgi:hypothetical protein
MAVSPPALVVALTAVCTFAAAGCGDGTTSDVASPGSASPMASASAARTAAETVEAFFAALRSGNADEAEKYVAEGAIGREALDDLARLGEAVTATVSGDGPSVQVQLRSEQPMQYWPQCPFSMSVTEDRQQIAGQTSCALPLEPSAA